MISTFFTRAAIYFVATFGPRLNQSFLDVFLALNPNFKGSRPKKWNIKSYKQINCLKSHISEVKHRSKLKFVSKRLFFIYKLFLLIFVWLCFIFRDITDKRFLTRLCYLYRARSPRAASHLCTLVFLKVKVSIL